VTHFLPYQEALAECPDAVADIIRQVNSSRKKPPKPESMTWMLCAGEDGEGWDLPELRKRFSGQALIDVRMGRTHCSLGASMPRAANPQSPTFLSRLPAPPRRIAEYYRQRFD
jgi:hypothetical protein